MAIFSYCFNPKSYSSRIGNLQQKGRKYHSERAWNLSLKEKKLLRKLLSTTQCLFPPPPACTSLCPVMRLKHQFVHCMHNFPMSPIRSCLLLHLNINAICYPVGQYGEDIFHWLRERYIYYMPVVSWPYHKCAHKWGVAKHFNGNYYWQSM